MRIILAGILLLTIANSCRNKQAGKEKPEVPVAADTTQAIPPNRDSLLTVLTNEVMTRLKNKQYDSLSTFIHPVAGIRFSPYGYVDTVKDVVLTREKLAAALNKKKQDKIVWGEYDGTGDPIRLTLNEYLREFVYDADFLTPENRKINGFLGAGNSENNILVMYPGCDFTDSHFSGFEKKYDGMDWKSLRLIFKLTDGKYYLVGIVHDEWTI